MRNKKLIHSGLFVCFLILIFVIPAKFNLTKQALDLPNMKEQTEVVIEVKPSANYWEINPITINGNNGWEVINSTYDWCIGNGTIENPYIIENIKINHIPLESGQCLAIEDSDVHFIIKNSIFYNAGGQIIDPPQSWGGNGIRLSNTTNGKIINNTCYDNGNNGIELYSHSNYNLIVNNTCFGNDDGGIYIGAYCENNTVLENKIGTNVDRGIATFRADNNRIINNSIIGNYDNHYGKGLYLRESDYNIISGNFIDHAFTGMELEVSDYNNITDNTIHYYQHTIQEVGVDSQYCEGNIIENNTLIFDDFMPPSMSIYKPQENQIFNHTAPSFDIYIVERLATGIESQYYTINNGIVNHTFTLINIHTGVDSYGGFISGDGIDVINQDDWNELNEGNITIRFYAKDNNGNLAYKEITVIKDIPEPNGPSISGFHPLIMVGIIVVLSVVLYNRKVKKN